jgi:hypothetical protein
MNQIETFKESIHQMMIGLFKEFGVISPIVFYLKDGKACIEEIPKQLFSSPSQKKELANIIKSICQTPNVLAAGIISQADCAMVRPDSEMINLIKNGSLKVSEIKDKKDVISMIFSTSESEEITTYLVDCEKKIVLEKISDENKLLGGIFSGFFKWNKN